MRFLFPLLWLSLALAFASILGHRAGHAAGLQRPYWASRWWWGWKWRNRREALLQWIAFRLPTSLVGWCVIRVIAYASVHPKLSATEVPDIRAMDALDLWGQSERTVPDTSAGAAR